MRAHTNGQPTSKCTRAPWHPRAHAPTQHTQVAKYSGWIHATMHGATFECASCPCVGLPPQPSPTPTPAPPSASQCNAGSSGPDGGECAPCVAGKYKDATGSAACSACPGSHYSPSASTASSACYPAPTVVFALAMGGNITASQVTANLTAQLLGSIASALRVDASLVRIISITDARRRLLAIAVNVQVTAADTANAARLAAKAGDVATAAQASASTAGLEVTVAATASVVPPPADPPGPLPSPPASPPPAPPLPSTPASEGAPAAAAGDARGRADSLGGTNFRLGLVAGLGAFLSLLTALP